ncbi:hypothetical protein [Salmonella enterica]|uniref:hypothetical protein n=1 Tax=Salmonella enterica TaxID=28901 RepID=UPI0021C48270|nr:hypothetical protein [Salmonella enterica]
MAMKYSWFHHHDCTTEQADTLISDYQKRGVRTEKSLNPDFITWTVSAKLPEYAHRGLACVNHSMPTAHG